MHAPVVAVKAGEDPAASRDRVVVGLDGSEALAG